MKKFIASIIILFITIGWMKAQTVLLDRDINESVYIKKKGPNQAHFFHLYLNLESYFSKGEKGFQAENILSYRDFIGLRNYYRITERYLMGMDVEFGCETFRLLQNSDKTFPSPDMHKKEVIYSYDLGMSYFNRILLTERETSLGTWLDIGIYGYYNCGTRHFMLDNAPPVSNGRLQQVTIKGLNYVERLNYGLKARLGRKRYAFTSTYRLADWIKKSTTPMEPPRFSIGLELGLY